MYKLRIYKKAQQEIKNISRLHQVAIIESLSEIKENPFIGKPLTRELTGRFTYKVGPYRIIYKVSKKDRIVQIITVEHRSKVYK